MAELTATGRVSARSLPVAEGRLELRGEQELFDAAARHALEARDQVHRRVEVASLGGTPAFFKGNRLRGRPALRHALRAALLRRLPPTFAELANLGWLRGQGFRAPRPLVAGVLWSSHLPRYQFLFTEHRPGAPTLEHVLREERGQERARVLDALPAAVARLHACGFVHRDLFPRNVLVERTAGGEPAFVYLDAWRSGPPRPLRGRAYDLACLLASDAPLLDRREEEELIAHYLDVARPAASFGSALARARRALERRARVVAGSSS